MSEKNIKDLINRVDEENTNRSELEHITNVLKKEIERLNFTINEQKILIKDLKNKLDNQDNLPEDVKILKDLVLSSRNDLKKKDTEIDLLKQKIEDLTTQIKNEVKGEDQSTINEDLNDASKLIVTLREENEAYQLQIEVLKGKLREKEALVSEGDKSKELQLANKKIDNLNLEAKKYLEQITTLQQELEDFKKLSSQSLLNQKKKGEIEKKLSNLEEENVDLKRNLKNSESTMTKLLTEIESFKNEISQQEKEIVNKNIKISALNEKNETLKRRMTEFQETPGKSLEKGRTFETHDVSEKLFDKESEEIVKKLKEENKSLNDIISKFKKNGLKPSIITNNVQYHELNLPKNYQFDLFKRMLALLDDKSKQLATDYLFQDLKSRNRDIKRFAINILSEIKGEKVFDAFKEMLRDEDWIVKLYLIKALSKFTDRNIKDSLNILLTDADSDVREAAKKVLDGISNK